MKRTFQFLLAAFVISAIFILRTNALDIETKDGEKFEGVTLEKLSAVGVRFQHNGKSRFVGTQDLTEKSLTAVQSTAASMNMEVVKPAADNSNGSAGGGLNWGEKLLENLKKVEGLTVPADQIVKFPDKAVYDSRELKLNLNIDYAASPNPKGQGSPVHITVAVKFTKDGSIFVSGEGELFLIDKNGKIVAKEKAPLEKLCPT